LVTSIAGSKLVLGKLKLRLANCNRASLEARGENTEMNVPTKAWSSPLIALSQGKEPPPQDRFAKLDAMRVHYQNYGEGRDAIVFIHGWSCNLDFWKANIPAFTEQSRVIAIDLPGHGESDKPQITYLMDLFALAIDAVITDAKVEQVTLVGHSMGVPVIRQFYRKHPDKTRALVIADGSLRMPKAPLNR
jgi:alpha-beta hydrolase superfamily lysophospholipase